VTLRSGADDKAKVATISELSPTLGEKPASADFVTRAAILERQVSAYDGAKNLQAPIYPGSEAPGAL
jgi:hypothetical protein